MPNSAKWQSSFIPSKQLTQKRCLLKIFLWMDLIQQRSCVQTATVEGQPEWSQNQDWVLGFQLASCALLDASVDVA